MYLFFPDDSPTVRRWERRIKADYSKFSLFSLVALSSLSALWVAAWTSSSQRKAMERTIRIASSALEKLPVVDESLLAGIRLADIDGRKRWLFHVPKEGQFEFCFASNTSGFTVHPLRMLVGTNEVKRLPLTSGEHRFELLDLNGPEKKLLSLVLDHSEIFAQSFPRSIEQNETGLPTLPYQDSKNSPLIIFTSSYKAVVVDVPKPATWTSLKNTGIVIWIEEVDKD